MLPRNRLSFLISDGKREEARTSYNSVTFAAPEGRHKSGYLTLNAEVKSFMLNALWIDVI